MKKGPNEGQQEPREQEHTVFENVVVPLDGSDLSATALPVAIKVCRASDAALVILSFADADEAESRRIRIEDQAALANTIGVETEVRIVLPEAEIEREIQKQIDALTKVLVCMSTHGRSRSEALTGSVASSLLQYVKTPVLLIGPDCDTAAFDPGGHLVVAIDGSRTSETIIPPAVWWAREFGSALEFITVLEPRVARAGVGHESLRGDISESVQVERHAHAAQKELGRVVNFEVLHGKKAAKVLLERLDSSGANIMAMATHGATGLRRVAIGSVTSNVVRHAKCPVMVLRPTE